MKHAFLIIAHKNINQLKRLVKQLQNENIDIYIHFDSKWNIAENKIDEFINSFENIYKVKERFSGVLDTWSLVEIAMVLINTAQEHEKTVGERYGYFYLLSGQDYPIKPINKILNYLEDTYPMPLIDCTPEVKTNWIHSTFKRIRHVNLYNKINKLSDNYKVQKLCKIPLYAYQEIETFLLGSPYKHLTKMGIKLYGGSAWWCLPNSVISYISEQWKNNKELVMYYSKATTPEETFFQTMTMMSPLAKQVIINKPDETKQNCMTYAYFQDVDKVATGHPYVFTVDEYEKIKKLPHLFARKFDELIDFQILDLIDEMINEEL